MLFINPLFEIEEKKVNNKEFSIVTVNSKAVIPETKIDTTIYVYVFQDTFISLYKSIRQKAIDLLKII